MARCQHCYMSVMFKDDGNCPACGKNKFDTAGVDPNKTLAIIGVEQPTPPCCFLCGAKTSRTRHMTYWYDVIESKSLIAKIFSRLPGSERRKAHRVTLPVCEGCTEDSKAVRPLSVRFDIDYRMAVHPRFRKQFEELNGPPQFEPT